MLPRAEVGGEGDAPVGAVLARCGKKADQRIPAPEGAPFPHLSMFGLTMRFAAIRRGRWGRDARPSSQPVGEGHAPRWGSTWRCLENRKREVVVPKEESLTVPQQVFPANHQFLGAPFEALKELQHADHGALPGRQLGCRERARRRPLGLSCAQAEHRHQLLTRFTVT